MRLRELIELIRQDQAEEREQVRLEREELRQERQDFREQRKELRDYIAIVSSLLAVAFTGWQGWEAHEARKDAQETAVQTRKDAERAMGVQMTIADRAAKEAERSADAAQKANDLSLQALHLSQSLSVDATASPQQEEISQGQSPKFLVGLRNNGKAGAYDLRGDIRLVMAEMSEEEAYKFSQSKSVTGVVSKTVLFPGTFIQATTSGPFLTSADIENLKAGRAFIWIFVNASYKDVFRQIHESESCFRYNVTGRVMDSCSGHNFSK